MDENLTNINKTVNVLENIHLLTKNIRTIFYFVVIFLLIGWTLIFIKPRGYISKSKTIHRYSGVPTNFNPSSVRMNNDLEITTSDNISIQGVRIIQLADCLNISLAKLQKVIHFYHQLLMISVYRLVEIH